MRKVFDEIIKFSHSDGSEIKVKKITAETNIPNVPFVTYQICSQYDGRWTVIKYDALLHYYKILLVQERKILIEKQIKNKNV